MARSKLKTARDTPASPKTGAAAKALCCAAGDVSPGPDQAVRYTEVEPRPAAIGDGQSALAWPSLTRSDMIELESIIPIQRATDDQEIVDNATISSKSTQQSMMKRVKKKLSRASTNFKKVPPKASKTALKKQTTGPPMADEENDPLALSFDRDAEPLEAADILDHLVQDVEATASKQLRRAQRGNIRSEESEHEAFGISANTHLVALENLEGPTSHNQGGIHGCHGHHAREESIIADSSTGQPTLQPPSLVDIAHPNTSTGHMSDLRLGKLSFEEAVADTKNRSDPRLSAIALAVDRCFSASSHYSEGEAGAVSRARMWQSSGADSHPAAQYRRLLGLPLADSRRNSELLQHHVSDASIHLQNMRISQHLRSFSSLSNDSLLQQAMNEPQTDYQSLGTDYGTTAATAGMGAERKEKSTEEAVSHRSALSEATPNTLGVAQHGKYQLPRSKDKQPISAGTRDPRRNLIPNVDGNFDEEANQQCSNVNLAPPTRSNSRATTVGSNYDETTSMWEKALTTHHKQVLDPSRRRGTSFSDISRKSISLRRASTESRRDSGTMDASGRRLSAEGEVVPVTLKRVNTALSFDRLQMPQPQSMSVPGSPNVQVDAEKQASNFLAIEGRQRSVSSPPRHDSVVPPEVVPEPRLLHSGGLNIDIPVPDIVLSEPGPDNDSMSSESVPGPLDHMPPSQRPWARFPKKGRELRIGSASFLTGDDVIVRDFQPEVDPEAAPGTSTDKIDHFGHKEKTKLRNTTVVLKRKLFTDLPSMFRSDSATFRRRQHGHRTSIALGGVLEYPELELLDPSTPRVAPVIEPGYKKEFSLATSNKKDNALPSADQAAASSNKGKRSKGKGRETPRRDDSPKPQDQAMDPTPTSHARERSTDSAHRKSSVESVSPLDGYDSGCEVDVRRSPGTKSLPGTRGRRPIPESVVLRSQSHQELRKSTQDLNELLERGWRMSLANALKAAEEPWE